MKNNKILLVITEYWYFLSHRKILSDYLIDKGFEVVILTNIGKHKISDEIYNTTKIVDWKLRRQSKNIFKEINSIYKLFSTIKEHKPDLIYSVGIKPIIYSSLYSKFFRKISFVYAFAGLGSIFININKNKIFLQKFIFFNLKLFIRNKNSLFIFQNEDDKNFVNNSLKLKIKQKIINGSGVDTDQYIPDYKNKNNIINITLPSRFLYDKGIMDFIYIAETLNKKKFKVNFLLVGKEDLHNPSAIKIQNLKKYEKKNIIKIYEDIKDMRKIYNKSHIICFPSFREGLPKALLEASSSGLPIVAYEVPGCKDVVDNNITGFLVPFRKKELLLEKIIFLIENIAVRKKFGEEGRKRMIKMFANNIILEKIYYELNELLSDNR